MRSKTVNFQVNSTLLSSVDEISFHTIGINLVSSQAGRCDILIAPEPKRKPIIKLVGN